MAAREKIEASIAALLESAIPNLTTRTGLVPEPTAEGKGKFASVGYIGCEGERLDHGQNELDESYQVIVWWPNNFARADALADWSSFRGALLLDQYLSGTVGGVQRTIADTFCVSETWVDAPPGDRAFSSMNAIVICRRVE